MIPQVLTAAAVAGATAMLALTSGFGREAFENPRRTLALSANLLLGLTLAAGSWWWNSNDEALAIGWAVGLTLAAILSWSRDSTTGQELRATRDHR